MTAHLPSPLPHTPVNPPLQRARGVARVGLRADGPVTRLWENYQQGSAKVRFPRTAPGEPVEAVLINTSGGITGGDKLSYAVTVETGARGLVTSQASERIYRRSEGVAEVATTLSVAAGASLDWLPQETILFDRSALSRTLTADVAGGARLLAVETIVLGRTAMGEKARSVTVSDAWRVSRDGRLIFADTLKLDGDAAGTMARGATGNGSAALATLVFLAPDAEAFIDRARDSLAGADGEAGVSAWNGMLVARLIAPTGQALRLTLVRLIEAIRGTPMPRVWNT